MYVVPIQNVNDYPLFLILHGLLKCTHMPRHLGESRRSSAATFADRDIGIPTSGKQSGALPMSISARSAAAPSTPTAVGTASTARRIATSPGDSEVRYADDEGGI